MIQDLFDFIKTELIETLPPKIARRIDGLEKKSPPKFGADPFGFDVQTIKAFAPIALWFYKNYFRVETFGAENIPSGKAMIIANHSGQLPFDGFMLGTAFILEPKIPRLLRGMVEKWSAEIPFVSTFFARVGQVIGTPETCNTLLDREEAVLVFPEGVPGITKLFSERYKLCRFGSGFLRIALATGAPILPVAIIGAEEQAPSIANITPLANALGVPAFPIIFPQIIPLPLPTKYRIHIGKPIELKGDGTEDDNDIAHMVENVKNELQNLVNFGLAKRSHIFF